MIEGWLRSQRGFAESIGEWTFYVVAMLLVLALVKRFPYRLFQKTHKWLAAGYLVFVYHAIVLTKFAYWTQPVGGALAALMLGGSITAIQVLTGKVGTTRHVAQITPEASTPAGKQLPGFPRPFRHLPWRTR